MPKGRNNRSGVDWSDPVAVRGYKQAHEYNRPRYVASERSNGNDSHLTPEQQAALMQDVSSMSLTEAARKHGVTRVTAVAYRKRAKKESD